MSDAIPLPPHPHLDYYRKLAKELFAARNDPSAIESWIARLPGQGAEQIARQLRTKTIVRLTDAQFFLARAHGFPSWPRFARHIRALQETGSADRNFEDAVEAIVGGDLDTLRRLLDEHPGLVHQRSAREHESTLLHYVSANGVEDYRQKTPENIVDITKLLLDRGSDVDAASKAYGGGSTTLYLVATSVHPEERGVARELMQLLLDRGARLDAKPGALLRACLANGRPAAAEFLAARGAPLDFESAAGVGAFDFVRAAIRTAEKESKERGFIWACAYGRDDIVRFLLREGVEISAGAGVDMTGLHLAAHEAHASTVQLLLEHGAPLEVKNSYGGTVLGQALWSAMNHRRAEHPHIVQLLLDAGAILRDDWRTGDEEIDRILDRARAERSRR